MLACNWVVTYSYSMDLLDYFGREHFVKYGEINETEKLATNAFFILVGKVAIPGDPRLPDFTNIGPGLVVVKREVTDLGELPEWARYARDISGNPASPGAVCESYAIGTLSLRRMTDFFSQQPFERPDRFGERAVELCDELLVASGI